MGLILATLFMSLVSPSAAWSQHADIETQARKQGMINASECRVNWGESAFDDTEGTTEN